MGMSVWDLNFFPWKSKRSDRKKAECHVFSHVQSEGICLLFRWLRPLCRNWRMNTLPMTRTMSQCGKEWGFSGVDENYQSVRSVAVMLQLKRGFRNARVFFFLTCHSWNNELTPALLSNVWTMSGYVTKSKWSFRGWVKTVNLMAQQPSIAINNFNTGCP